MPNQDNSNIAFSFSFEGANGYGTGLTGTSSFKDSQGNVVTQPSNPTETQAQEFYQKYFISKEEGYNLGTLPKPMQVITNDAAINQGPGAAHGTLMMAADKMGIQLQDANGNPIDFGKAELDKMYYDNGVSKQVNTGQSRYQDTDISKLYEANKDKIIDAYNKMSPEAQKNFLDEMSESRMELYSRTAGRTQETISGSGTKFEEWANRTIAADAAAKALIDNPNMSEAEIKAFATDPQYKNAAYAFSEKLGSAGNSVNDKNWYAQVNNEFKDAGSKLEKGEFKKAPVRVAKANPNPNAKTKAGVAAVATYASSQTDEEDDGKQSVASDEEESLSPIQTFLNQIMDLLRSFFPENEAAEQAQAQNTEVKKQASPIVDPVTINKSRDQLKQIVAGHGMDMADNGVTMQNRGEVSGNIRPSATPGQEKEAAISMNA